MATALASQLQALASRQAVATEKRPLTRPSLLFEPRQAADIDLLTIYNLALSGLEELSNMSNLFESYKKALFSPESNHSDRDLQGREFNSKLNNSISSYLRLLSGFLLLTPAHQTLEYLIRRYQVHVYNVDVIVKSFLPYHETSLFVRMVQILDIEKTKWRFLEGVKTNGASLPRAVLVQQCLQDLSVLESICDTASVVSENMTSSRIAISFSVAVVMECLGAGDKTSASIFNKILPFVLHSFGKGVPEEFRVGGLMIISCVVSKANLSRKVIKMLFDSIAKNTYKDLERVGGEKLFKMSMMVLIHIMQMQSLEHFPDKAFKFLVKARDLPDILAEISASFNANKFTSLFLKSLVKHSVLNKHYENTLVEYIDKLRLEHHMESVIAAFIDLCNNIGTITGESTDNHLDADSETRNTLKRLLSAIDAHYPDQLSKGINNFLETSSGTSKFTVDLLTELLHGSLSCPMQESNKTVYLSLEHPEAQVREAAIKKVSNILSVASTENKSKVKLLVGEALLQCFYDENFGVVQCVYSVDGLVKLINADQLFEAQVSILSRCFEAFAKGNRTCKEEAESVGKLCLHFLSSEFLQDNPLFLQRVGCVFLNALLLFSKTAKLNLAALGFAQSLSFPLFSNLRELNDDSCILTNGDVKASKRSKRGNINQKIVSLLAQSLMEHPETSIPCWADDLTNFGRAKVLILLILLHCVQNADSGCKWIYMEKTLNFLKQEWSPLETKKILNNSLLKVSYSEADTKDMLSSEILVTLESDFLSGYSKLLAMSFYRILKLVPSFQMDENEDQRHKCFKVLKELFILFSMSSVRKSLREHFKLILDCVSSYVVDFLSAFFLEEASAFSQDVQKNSIEQMKALFESLSTAGAYHIQSSHLQISMPRLLVALCSPYKVVRKVACECLQNIQALWSNHAQSLIKNGSQVLDVPYLPQSTFMAFVGALTEFSPTFLSDEKFLSIFLTSVLGNNESMQGYSLQVNERFTTESVRSIVLYLIQHAVKLPTYAKCVLILSLEGLGQVVFEVAEVHVLLLELLERRRKFHLKSTITAEGKLNSVEIKLMNSIIRNILQLGDINTRNMEQSAANRKIQIFFEATNVDGGILDDIAVIEPCQIALNSLHTEDYDKWDFSMQDQVLQRMLSLSSTDCESLRSAASSALRNIHINAAAMAKQIKKLCSLTFDIKSSSSELTNVLKSTTELLEFLLWKVDIGNRLTLVEPLFELLEKFFPLESLSNNVLQEYSGDASPATLESSDISSMRYIQELVVTILDGIAISASNESPEIVESIEKIYKVDFIVRIISVVSDTSTRNQALKLLTTLAKSIPYCILNYVMKVFEIVGKLTVIQDDTHSHLVTEQLIAAVVPSWLAQTKNSRELVEIFVRAMPKIPVLRRMPLVKNTLRIMGETENLHVFVLLLLEASLKVLESTRPILKKKNRTDKKKIHASSEDTDDWATEFSGQLCEQFSPSLRLHAFIHLLEVTRSDANGISISEIDDHWPLQQKIIKFVSVQLQRSDLLSELESDQNGACQEAIVSLLEQVLLHLRWLSDCICSPKTKKLLQDSACSLLDSLTEILSLASFAKGIAYILKRSDTRVKLRVLKLVSEKMKEKGSSKLSGWVKALNVPECKDACVEMVMEVGNVLKCTSEAVPYSSLMNIKLAAVSALDVCAIRFGAKLPDVFVNNFRTVLTNLHNIKLTVVCLSCMATLVSQLGVHLLPVLSEVVSETLKFANGKLSEVKEETISDKEENTQTSDTGFHIALLTFLGSIIENQGGFLNPYLKNILSLLIMQPEFNSNANSNSNSNTDDAIHRKVQELHTLIAEKIPARLLLDPLLKLYEKAVKEGEASTAACFHILSVVAIKLDRDSVVQYHKRMLDFCLTALDLRRKRPESFKSVTKVETYVISVITNLVMKLSESTFKPFFVKVHEWAESEVPDDSNGTIRSLDRSIAFFKLVNQLGEKLRSILVPYFQYLLNGCVRHLTNGEEEPVKKRKKSEKSSSEQRKSISSTEWHLRFVVISALHKCFVYDTVGFLDASKFQVVLGPIVQQIVVVPPAEASKADDVPKVSEMDEALVSCLGQMALAAKSDLLWKPLNHEVLLCTRNESVRARTLGLDIVKYLVEHLKEDYLVLLPETIPFLAELLEDPELTVISRSQDIIKMLEELSGESLQQYL